MDAGALRSEQSCSGAGAAAPPTAPPIAKQGPKRGRRRRFVRRRDDAASDQHRNAIRELIRWLWAALPPCHCRRRSARGYRRDSRKARRHLRSDARCADHPTSMCFAYRKSDSHIGMLIGDRQAVHQPDPPPNRGMNIPTPRPRGGADYGNYGLEFDRKRARVSLIQTIHVFPASLNSPRSKGVSAMAQAASCPRLSRTGPALCGSGAPWPSMLWLTGSKQKDSAGPDGE